MGPMTCHVSRVQVLDNSRVTVDGVDVSLRLWDTFGDHHKVNHDDSIWTWKLKIFFRTGGSPMAELTLCSCATTLAAWSPWSTAGQCGTSRSGDSVPTPRSSWWAVRTTRGSSTRMNSISATARRGVLLSGERISKLSDVSQHSSCFRQVQEKDIVMPDQGNTNIFFLI